MAFNNNNNYYYYVIFFQNREGTIVPPRDLVDTSLILS